MGNICPWCKKINDSDLNQHDETIRTNSQRSLTSDDVNDRTPYVIAFILTVYCYFSKFIFFLLSQSLLSKSASQHQYNQPVISVASNTPSSPESSSLISNIVAPLPPPILNTNQTESTTGRIYFIFIIEHIIRLIFFQVKFHRVIQMKVRWV